MEECVSSDLIQALNDEDDNISVDSVQLMAEINEFINESNDASSTTKQGFGDKKKLSVEPTCSGADSTGPCQDTKDVQGYKELKRNQPFVVIEQMDLHSVQKKSNESKSKTPVKETEVKKSAWYDDDIDDASLSELSVSDFSLSDIEVESIQEIVDTKSKRASSRRKSGEEQSSTKGPVTTKDKIQSTYSKSNSVGQSKSCHDSSAGKKKDVKTKIDNYASEKKHSSESKKHDDSKKDVQKSSSKDGKCDSESTKTDGKKRIESSKSKQNEFDSMRENKNWRFELNLSKFSFDELNNESFRKFINLATDCAFDFSQFSVNNSFEGTVNLYFGDYATMQSAIQKLGQVSFTSTNKIQGLIVGRQMTPVPVTDSKSKAASNYKGNTASIVKMTFTLQTAWTDKLKQLVQVKDWKKGDKKHGIFAKILRLPSVISTDVLSLLFPFSLDIHSPNSQSSAQTANLKQRAVDIEFASTELMETVLCCFQDVYISVPSAMLSSYKVFISNVKPRSVPPGHKDTNVKPATLPGQHEYSRQGRLFPCQVADEKRNLSGHRSTRTGEWSSSFNKNRDRKRPLKTSEDRVAPPDKRNRLSQSEEKANVEGKPTDTGRNLEDMKKLAQAQGLDPNNSGVLCILELQRQLESMQSLMTRPDGHTASQAGLLPIPQSLGSSGREKELAEAEQKLRDNIALRQKQLQELESKLKTSKDKNVESKDKVNKENLFLAPDINAPPPNQNDQPLDFKKPEPKVEQAVKADEIRSKLSAIGKRMASPKNSVQFVPQQTPLKPEDCALPLGFGKNVEKVSPKIIEHKTTRVIGNTPRRRHSQERLEFRKGNNTGQRSGSHDRHDAGQRSRERGFNRNDRGNVDRDEGNSQRHRGNQRGGAENKNSLFSLRSESLENDRNRTRSRSSEQGRGFTAKADIGRNSLERRPTINQQKDLGSNLWPLHNAELEKDLWSGRAQAYGVGFEKAGKQQWMTEGKVHPTDKRSREYDNFYSSESEGLESQRFPRSPSFGTGVKRDTAGQTQRGGSSARGLLLNLMVSKGVRAAYSKDLPALGQFDYDREQHRRDQGKKSIQESSMSGKMGIEEPDEFYSYGEESEGKSWSTEMDRFSAERHGFGQGPSLRGNRGGRGSLQNKRGGLQLEPQSILKKRTSRWDNDPKSNDYYTAEKSFHFEGEATPGDSVTDKGRQPQRFAHGRIGDYAHSDNGRDYLYGDSWNESRADLKVEPVAKRQKTDRYFEEKPRLGVEDWEDHADFGGRHSYEIGNPDWFDGRETTQEGYYSEKKGFEEYGVEGGYGKEYDDSFGYGEVYPGEESRGGAGGRAGQMRGRGGDAGRGRGSDLSRGRGGDAGRGRGSDFNRGRDGNVGRGRGGDSSRGRGSDFNRGRGGDFSRGRGGDAGRGSDFSRRAVDGNQDGFGRDRNIQKGFMHTKSLEEEEDSFFGNQNQREIQSRRKSGSQTSLGRGQGFQDGFGQGQSFGDACDDDGYGDGFREQPLGRGGFGGRGRGSNDTRGGREEGGVAGSKGGRSRGRGRGSSDNCEHNQWEKSYGHGMDKKTTPALMPNDKPGLLGAVPTIAPGGVGLSNHGGHGNTGFGSGNTGFGSGNTSRGSGNTGFGSGNTTRGGGKTGFGSGNTGFGSGNTSRGGGNTGFGSGNTTRVGGKTGFGSGNNSHGGGNTGFGSENNSRGSVYSGRGRGGGNTSRVGGNTGFGSGNTSRGVGNTGFGNANTNRDSANNGRGGGNSGFSLGASGVNFY